MIDTDKYEGHTPGPWCVDECDGYNTHEDNPAGFHIYASRLREDVAPYPISNGLPLATNVYYYRNAFNKKGFLDSEMSKVVQEEALKLRETTSEYANSLLMADAPLLLAEVKRLQSIISVFDEYMMNDFMSDMSRSEAHAIWNELVRGDGI